jgi:hypothetical protein
VSPYSSTLNPPGRLNDRVPIIYPRVVRTAFVWRRPRHLERSSVSIIRSQPRPIW